MMKKSISLILCLMLVLGFSLNSSAQSGENELDQVELLKQFIGTWEVDLPKDTVLELIFTPLNNGLHMLQNFKLNGETYLTYNGVLGFSSDKQMIYQLYTNPDGTIIFDEGRFETKTKYTVERYFGNTSHAGQILEFEFVTPDTYTLRLKARGDGMTWPTDWNELIPAKKVK